MFGKVGECPCKMVLKEKWRFWAQNLILGLRSAIIVHCTFPDRTITKVVSSPVHKVIRGPGCPIIETHGQGH